MANKWRLYMITCGFYKMLTNSMIFLSIESLKTNISMSHIWKVLTDTCHHFWKDQDLYMILKLLKRVLKKVSNQDIQRVELQAGKKMKSFMMTWKCNFVHNAKNCSSQTKLTSVTYWERNIKMHKKHLTKMKTMNKHKDKQNKNSLNNKRKERSF